MLSKWTGKKWLAIGDSITEHNFRTSKNYHNYIAEKIGCTVINEGHSGTGWRTPNREGSLPIYKRISGYTLDCDLITVYAGTNDWGQSGISLVMGTFGDTDPAASFYGSVDYVIKQLVAKYPTKTIAVFTPLQRSDGFVANSAGVTLEQIADAIIKVSNHYGIPVLDLYRLANLNVWNSESNNYYFTPSGKNIPVDLESADGLHPNDNGHKVLADKILSFLNSL
nr:SGNH/GDSL hydrolase family protein [Fredinandcohnia onubensis]